MKNNKFKLIILLLLLKSGVAIAQGLLNSTVADSKTVSAISSHNRTAAVDFLAKNRGKSAYFIQVYASNSYYYAKNFIRHSAISKHLSIIKLKNNKNYLYKVTYNKSFNSYRLASQALQKLQKQLAHYKPWITKLILNSTVKKTVSFKVNNQHVGNKDTREKFYVEAGLQYINNLAPGNSNTISVVQVPGTTPVLINYQNNSKINGFSPYFGAGYRWFLSQDISLSLGAEISYYNFLQKGHYGGIGSADEAYSYKITTLLFNTVTRMIYSFSSKNKLYTQLTLGIARLSSHDFSLNDDTQSLSHHNEIVNQLDYGVGIGWRHKISKNINIDFNIGYIVLGDAILGPRKISGNASTSGHVKQLISGISSNVGIEWNF